MGCPCLLKPLFVIYADEAFLHKILISAAARQLMVLTMFFFFSSSSSSWVNLFTLIHISWWVLIFSAYSRMKHFLFLKICFGASGTSVFFLSTHQPSIHACSYVPLLTCPWSATSFFSPTSQSSICENQHLLHTFRVVRLLLPLQSKTHTHTSLLTCLIKLLVYVFPVLHTHTHTHIADGIKCSCRCFSCACCPIFTVVHWSLSNVFLSMNLPNYCEPEVTHSLCLCECAKCEALHVNWESQKEKQNRNTDVQWQYL